MPPVYSHELGRYIALGKRTAPVEEGKEELRLTPIVVEVRLRSGRIVSAPAVQFFNREGLLVIQAVEESRE